MKPRQPASAEYTLTQWNQEPVDEPAPAVVGHTKIVRMIGRATKKPSPAHYRRRVTSLNAIRAAVTTSHITEEYQGIVTNRNMGITFLWPQPRGQGW